MTDADSKKKATTACKSSLACAKLVEVAGRGKKTLSEI